MSHTFPFFKNKFYYLLNLPSRIELSFLAVYLFYLSGENTELEIAIYYVSSAFKKITKNQGLYIFISFIYFIFQVKFTIAQIANQNWWN